MTKILKYYNINNIVFWRVIMSNSKNYDLFGSFLNSTNNKLPKHNKYFGEIISLKDNIMFYIKRNNISNIKNLLVS